MPKTRREFEHNMNLLAERMRRGEIHIAQSNFRTIKGLRNAKIGPNKRPNLHTIDEMARLMANTMLNFENQFNDAPEQD